MSILFQGADCFKYFTAQYQDMCTLQKSLRICKNCLRCKSKFMLCYLICCLEAIGTESSKFIHSVEEKQKKFSHFDQKFWHKQAFTWLYSFEKLNCSEDDFWDVFREKEFIFHLTSAHAYYEKISI